jgi:hypothetical protein
MEDRGPKHLSIVPSRWLYCGLCLLLGAILLAGGCTRRFFRNNADKEVNDILAEKDRYPQWKIEQYHVYSDPRARFADPTNPDRPPMPPDDEAAWKLAPHSQRPGRKGTVSIENTAYVELLRAWDEENRAQQAAEAEKAKAEVPAPPPGPEAKPADYKIPAAGEPTGGTEPTLKPFLITLDQSVELGLINSRDYQSIREDLYLAALPVTQQRFSFAWQFAALEDAFRQWAGPFSREGQQNNWTLNSTAGVSKLFSTGALLTFQFANTTVFNFLNFAHGTTSQSTISLDFVQPLLRGGGKAVTLEPLTQAERNLVYSIRAYAHFREQFYLSIALGTTNPANLSAAAGIGGFVAGSPIGVLASLGIASTDVAGQFRGYLPTLFRELDMAVDKKLVTDLEVALKQIQALQEGGDVTPLQVDQATTTLLNAKNAVLKDIQDTTNAMDQLKLQMGLPANAPLLLDDSLARPMTDQMNRYYEVYFQSKAAFNLVEQQEKLSPAELRAFLRRLFTTDPLVQGTPFQKKILPSWDAWAKVTAKALKERQDALGKERRQLLDLKAELETANKPVPPEKAQRLNEVDFESDVGGLEEVLRRYEARPWEKLKGEKAARQRTLLFRIVGRAAEAVLVWARNDRVAQTNERWPALAATPLEDLDLLTADVEKAQEVTVQAAMRNRWDLMNARAQVVDAWRQLAVTANALMGVFNVQYHLDSQTPPFSTHALAFASTTTNQELILNAQLPLVRVVERNNYRAALIAYQRARRALMSAEDNLAAQVRFDVRQLHLFAENYKIQQKVVELNYSQVESSGEQLLAPPQPAEAGAPPAASTSTLQATASTLTGQYLGAFSGLNGAQTKMYDIWLSYLATRMQVYLDVEMLALDNRGVWLDPVTAGSGAAGACLGQPTPGEPREGTVDTLPAPRVLPPPATSPRQ